MNEPNHLKSLLVYEQAVGERVRTFLRIDFLVRQFEHYSPQPSLWDTRTSIQTLLGLVNLINRRNIKLDLIKELSQRIEWLKALGQGEDVDPERLNHIVNLHEKLLAEAHELTHPVQQELMQYELLNTITQRVQVPGGMSESDLPVYYNWLVSHQADHAELLQQWFKPLDPVVRIAREILNMIRESASFTNAHAVNGWYEEKLDIARRSQMIRVRLSAESGLYPEISVGRQRFSIIFRDGHDGSQRPEQATEDLSFELACCLF